MERFITYVNKGGEDLANWQCPQCNAEWEARCKPKKCPKCNEEATFAKKEVPKEGKKK